MRQISDLNYTPIKGDNVELNGRSGILLDENFVEIQWLDNDEIQTWIGGWSSFINNGGFILVI